MLVTSEAGISSLLIKLGEYVMKEAEEEDHGTFATVFKTSLVMYLYRPAVFITTHAPLCVLIFFIIKIDVVHIP